MTTRYPDPKHVRAATVMFVEDDMDNYWLLEDLLVGEVGVAHVVPCYGSKAFLQALDHGQYQPDLILLDLQMKGEDGIALFRRIRERPDLCHVPVVLVTANVMTNKVEWIQRAGIKSVIGKPLNRRLFPSQIARALAGEAVWEPYG